MQPKTRGTFPTLGGQAARLVAILHERQRRVFKLADVAEITGLKEDSARSFVRKLVQRAVATRLQPGLFILVPFELGRGAEYHGNPYVVARHLMGQKSYYLSHASAMSLHGMTAQPQFIVYATSPAPMRGRQIMGTEFRFVRCKPPDFFGTSEHWLDKQERVIVSDLERTIIDGLKQPEHCGGFTEVAKGLGMRRDDWIARGMSPGICTTSGTSSRAAMFGLAK